LKDCRRHPVHDERHNEAEDTVYAHRRAGEKEQQEAGEGAEAEGGRRTGVGA